MAPAPAASAVAAPALHLRDGCAHGVSRYAILDNCMLLLYHIVDTHGMGKGRDFYARLQE